MESIDDAHKKLAAKRQKTSDNEAINRLATPKNQSARRRFRSDSNFKNQF
jgi:hypothetical protein